MNKKSYDFFQEFNVWKRIDDTSVMRYRCFRVLPDEGYYVQSADNFYYPLDQKQVIQLECSFVDSLFQDGLEAISQNELRKTLEEAIAFFEEGFE